MEVTIKRRIREGKQEITEKAQLLKTNAKTCWVKLSNGDIIKRKKKDVEMK
jgi:hypothetical protein